MRRLSQANLSWASWPSGSIYLSGVMCLIVSKMRKAAKNIEFSLRWAVVHVDYGNVAQISTAHFRFVERTKDPLKHPVARSTGLAPPSYPRGAKVRPLIGLLELLSTSPVFIDGAGQSGIQGNRRRQHDGSDYSGRSNSV
jgi:hypothetical protein